MATVFIPTPLRKFTNNTAKVEAEGNNVSEVVKALTNSYPELKRHLVNADGRIPSFINIFVGDDDIRSLQQEQTPVKENSQISIVPAIAGGKPVSKL
ncbi:MAG: MoaD/ThiS family protein [Cyclobacteriaceae bacterium]|nr:MoaD/ThiS family protein [Cyclobacteriaceae bacterium]MDH4294784.1 MoaD/ThiS family protein [Cyclobacteriaceae bacterium]MDH5249253.1 MoaD/ThiS family protein [Cyclobacteriaceae bacterium]